MNTNIQPRALRVVDLGTASGITKGWWFGDYYDGMFWPHPGFKLGPG